MIRAHIVQHLLHKLAQQPSLLVYDPSQRYAPLLPLLRQEGVAVFDSRDSVLEAWEGAYRYFSEQLSAEDAAPLLVYVPFAAPRQPEDRIRDPFAIFALGDHYFPRSAADQYKHLCKACFEDQQQRIEELFAQGEPDFDTIDALGGGETYAKLQTLTGGKSEQEILRVLLAPSETQLASLQRDTAWFHEWRQLAAVLGLSSQSDSLEAVQDELWRFLLFSEFVLDLPVALPADLGQVPVAKPSASELVLSLGRSLRSDTRCEETYVAQADRVAEQLGLDRAFAQETNLGEISTFAFEDNANFQRLVALVEASDWNAAQTLIAQRRQDIWPRHDPQRRLYWKLAEAGLQLMQATEVGLPRFSGLGQVIDYYTEAGFRIDQHQRRYERLLVDILEPPVVVRALTEQVRRRYRAHSQQLQAAYQEHFTRQPWPLAGYPSNLDLYASRIAPALKSKGRVAFFMVDALRYELARELEAELGQYFKIETQASCAYLPTVTQFGMAALLPEADKQLHLNVHKGKLEAFMGDTWLKGLAERRQWWKDKLGDRVEVCGMAQINGGEAVPHADLLVVTTNDLDQAGENLDATEALMAMRQATQALTKALLKLKQEGYSSMIVATDHGFVLHQDFQPGDQVSKPAGDWVMKKARSLAGKGDTPGHCLRFAPEQLGIRSEVPDFVFLQHFAVFEKNRRYFHEGLSLQENLLPVMRLTVPKSQKQRRLQVQLSYRGKSQGSITTQRPLIELSCQLEGDLGFATEAVSLKLEARSADGQLVGEPLASSDYVSPTTQLVEVMPSPGERYKVPLEMQEAFEGAFDILASDPATNQLLAKLSLTTNYL